MRSSFFIILLCLSCTVLFAAPKRQMRGAWIATVANIDWPKKEAVGRSKEQKQDMILMLDSLQRLNFNMVVFQIRPTADAFYYSELEPLSSWLTGSQGKDNDEPYDPLQFVISEAHKRCIDVHVWLNPYRATHTFTADDLDSTHIFRQHPEWFFNYADKWYFNPGLDQTRQWLVQVVADIVSRYDIDAVHFDDYFYPYKVRAPKGSGQVWLDFPDEQTFTDNPRGFTDKDAWRRNNVNMIIEELQQTIKNLKPWVEFGISPFGVWRNKSSDPERGSNTQAGVQNYDDLYADILLWLDRGWIDYVAPQLYWEIGKKVADYKILAHWWAENCYGRNLYVGHYASALTNPKAADAWKQPNELCRQLRLNETIDDIDGSIMYSATPMLTNPQGLLDSLENNFYRYPALPPINRNIAGLPPMPPQSLTISGHTLHWQPADDGMYYVVYAFPLGETIDFDNPAFILSKTTELSYTLDEPDRYEAICVTAVNHYKQESMPCILKNYTY